MRRCQEVKEAGSPGGGPLSRREQGAVFLGGISAGGLSRTLMSKLCPFLVFCPHVTQPLSTRAPLSPGLWKPGRKGRMETHTQVGISELGAGRQAAGATPRLQKHLPRCTAPLRRWQETHLGGTQAVTRPQRTKWGAPGRLGGSPAPTVTSLHLDKSLTKGRLFGLLCASENEGSRA